MRTKSCKWLIITLIGYCTNPEFICGSDVGYTEEELKHTSTDDLLAMLKSIILYFKLHTRQRTRNIKFRDLLLRIKKEINFRNNEVKIKKEKEQYMCFLNRKRFSSHTDISSIEIPSFFNDTKSNSFQPSKTTNETMSESDSINEEEINTDDCSSLHNFNQNVSDSKSIDFTNFIYHSNSNDFELSEDDLNDTFKTKNNLSIDIFINEFSIKEWIFSYPVKF